MRKTYFLLFLIFALATFLRIYNIPETLLFHFDQGYHGLAIKQIWETKRIALLGHKTDVEGIFHGSTFYYLMLPIYLISSWDPARVSMILAFLDGLCLIFIFLIGKDLFGKKVGLLASLFYATSYSVISFSRWLSNVTLIPFLATIFFYFLLKAYQGSLIFFPLACLLGGLIIQLNGAIGFFFLPLMALVFWFLKKRFLAQKKYLTYSIGLFLLPNLPLIFFDLRHNFLVSRSIIRLFFKEGNLGMNLGRILKNLEFLKIEIVNLFSHQIPLISLTLAVLTLVAVTCTFVKKKKEAKSVKLICLFVLIPFLGQVFYKGGIHGFFIVGILPVITLLFAWSLFYWGRKKTLKVPIVVLILTILFLNLLYWRGFLKPGFNLIPIGTRNLITLEDRKKAVDFMYQKAKGEDLRTDIYIIPYFQYQVWDYVFSWYGQKTYGYLPKGEAEKTFVIYEPDYDFPYRLDSWLGKIEEDHGGVVSVFKSHDLTVEEREK